MRLVSRRGWLVRRIIELNKYGRDQALLADDGVAIAYNWRMRTGGGTI